MALAAIQSQFISFPDVLIDPLEDFGVLMKCFRFFLAPAASRGI
jgi:hypothetical protein